MPQSLQYGICVSLSVIYYSMIKLYNN